MEVAMYALLSLPFLATVLLLDLIILKTKVVTTKPFWIILAIMVSFTLVFDQFFTGLPIVEYDQSLISGIKLGYAPIEDFLYTIAAVIGIGALVTYETKS